MKKFLRKSEDSFRNCKKIRTIYKMSGEVSKNFETIMRNFEENFLWGIKFCTKKSTDAHVYLR